MFLTGFSQPLKVSLDKPPLVLDKVRLSSNQCLPVELPFFQRDNYTINFTLRAYIAKPDEPVNILLVGLIDQLVVKNNKLTVNDTIIYENVTAEPINISIL